MMTLAAASTFLRLEEPKPRAQQYNIMLGEIIGQDTEKLQVNISAVRQNEALNAAYILNGLADDRRWYQIGIDSHCRQACPLGRLDSIYNTERHELLPSEKIILACRMG